MSLAKDVKSSAYWDATQSYPFSFLFAFSFFRIKTSSKNYIMREVHAKNTVNERQNASNEFL